MIKTNLLDSLAGCAGTWRGDSTLQDPHSGAPDKSPSKATFATISEHSFHLEYDWSYREKPQAGSLAISFDGQRVTAQWIDTWHTGNKPMDFSGVIQEGMTMSVRGTYAAPPGPDWGWRIDLTPDGERLRLVMWNVWPVEQGAKEDLAVEAEYTRIS